MNATKPKDIHCAHSQRVSWAEWEALPARIQGEMDSRSREALAEFVQRNKVSTETVRDPDGLPLYVEKRIDLYVATPAEFWACVKAEAERIAYHSRRMLSPQSDLK